MTKKLDIAVGFALAALVIAGGVAANSYLRGEEPIQSANAAEAASVKELLTISRAGDESALRTWLVKQGPDAAHRAVLSLDNANDRAATVRIEVLRTIYSLSSEGMSDESVKSWAVALRSLSNTMLHEGPDRADFIARSYVMEGRLADAAAEYRHFPASGAASTFFGSYPDLRAPASITSPAHVSPHK